MIICPDNVRLRDDGTYDSSADASERAWSETYAAIVGALLANPARVVLLVGLPGSGKSTWARAQNDDLAYSTQSIFVDATFSRRVERAPVIQMAAQRRIPVDAVVFLTPLLECMSRNATRTPDRRVPFSVIARMDENLRRDHVLLDEGFRSITAIRPEAP